MTLRTRATMSLAACATVISLAGCVDRAEMTSERSTQVRVTGCFQEMSGFDNPENDITDSDFGIISGTANSGREGIDERFIRVGIRFGF